MAQPPDIPDPWEGPRTYAEDFYSGGDVLPESLENATPSHLTPREDKLYIPGITSPIDESSKPKVNEPSGPAGDLSNDDLYADIEQVPTEKASVDAVDETPADDPDAPVSPPPTHLTRHVDWNWPPAFSGKVATGAGHLAGEQSEIIAISDDEDDEAGPVEAAEASAIVGDAVDEQAPYVEYTDFSLYDMGPSGSSLDLPRGFEPVGPNELDFGDLPPSRGERFLDPSLASNDGEDERPHNQQPAADDAEIAEASALLQYPEDEVDDEKPSDVERQAPGPDVVVEEVEDDDDGVPLATTAAEFDVLSVSGDDFDVLVADYSVEEVATEGRRTAVCLDYLIIGCDSGSNVHRNRSVLLLQKDCRSANYLPRSRLRQLRRLSRLPPFILTLKRQPSLQLSFQPLFPQTLLFLIPPALLLRQLLLHPPCLLHLQSTPSRQVVAKRSRRLSPSPHMLPCSRYSGRTASRTLPADFSHRLLLALSRLSSSRRRQLPKVMRMRTVILWRKSRESRKK